MKKVKHPFCVWFILTKINNTTINLCSHNTKIYLVERDEKKWWWFMRKKLSERDMGWIKYGVDRL